MSSPKSKYYKNILYVDLNEETAQIKVIGDVYEFIGGISLAYKLMDEYFEEFPLIFTTGPLCGYFPYLSKACFLYSTNGKIVEKYGGGTLAAKMNFAGIDAIVIIGQQKDPNLNISIRSEEISVTSSRIEKNRTDLFISKNEVNSNEYFTFGDFTVESIPNISNLSFRIEASMSHDLSNVYEYENLYASLLDMYRELTVEPRNNPSCMGCPMGCDRSHEGEDDVNVAILPRSLISCGFAAQIYKQIPIVFACLTTIGYDYTHSDIEKLPEIFLKVKESVNEKLNKVSI